ncbi:MAG: hypothetical protein WD767_02775 [Alphaproteobacteria bacterium]
MGGDFTHFSRADAVQLAGAVRQADSLFAPPVQFLKIYRYHGNTSQSGCLMIEDAPEMALPQ